MKSLLLMFALLLGAGTMQARTIEAKTTFNFDDGMQGWTTIDADGDGYAWEHSSEPYSYFDSSVDISGTGYNSSEGFVVSGSYSNNYGVLYPDNYLVSPKMNLGGKIYFYACAQDVYYPAEYFGVAVSVNGNTDPDDFEMLQEWTMTRVPASGAAMPAKALRAGGPQRVQGAWYLYEIDLSRFAGKKGYVAIRHFDCYDNFCLDIDDIAFDEATVVPTYTVTLDRTEGGFAKATPKKDVYEEKDAVNVYVKAYEGYAIKSVKAVTDGGKTVSVKVVDGDKTRESNYSFKMPADNVTVNVVFQNLNVKNGKFGAEDGNSYIVTDPEEQVVSLNGFAEGETVIVVPTEVYYEKADMKFTVGGITNAALKDGENVTDVYVQDKKNVLTISGKAFADNMPNAKLHVYQTLLKGYADMMPELLEGRKLVTDIENRGQLFTFSNATNVELPEDVKQYVCDYDGSVKKYGAAAPAVPTMKATRIEDQVVTAHNGVLLQAERGIHEFAAVAEAGAGDYENNDLSPVEGALVIETKNGVYTVNGESFFHIMDQWEVVPDGTAVLVLTDEKKPDEIAVVFDDEVTTEEPGDDVAGAGESTGINDINAEGTTNTWFDLSGRKVAQPTTKGVYVINGKKVVLK